MPSSNDVSLELPKADTEDELPLCPHIPLLRQRAMIFSEVPVAIYMIKQSGQLITDYGQLDDPQENPDIKLIGKNPKPCMPMNKYEAFQSELKNARHAFFQRPVVRKILYETLSMPKDLIEIIVRYRCHV